MALSRVNNRYLDQFDTLDSSSIGTCVGKGMQHEVFNYGKDKVLKIPIDRFWYPRPSLQTPARDLEDARAYFGAYLVDTALVASRDGQNYCIVQEKISTLENITPTEVDPTIIEQLMALIARNREVVKAAGISLDFLGKEGLEKCLVSEFSSSVQPAMSNVVKDANGRVIIPDVSLLRLRETAPGLRGHVSRLVTKTTFGLNRGLIKRHFHEDIS